MAQHIMFVAEVAQEKPLLQVRQLSKSYGVNKACYDISFDLYEGEVLGIVGESGSGKTTLLRLLCAGLQADTGSIVYRSEAADPVEICGLNEAKRRQLLRSEWGYVQQNPRNGLRMGVSAGANIGERLMAVGARHYGNIRDQASTWLDQVEIDRQRIDDAPQYFSGGMQQRLQIARNLVTQPRLILMDEPTGGLDVSVQARLLDMLRGLVSQLRLSAIVVTHDLAVARLLSHRLLVMYRGTVVEQGLTDQVLDDPQHPYSQLLVSSVLSP